MPETVQPYQHETLNHRPEWRMDTRRGGFETQDELNYEISRRVKILDQNEPATEGPVVGFLYGQDEYDTHIEVSDDYGQRYSVELPLMEFLHAEDDENPDGKYERQRIEDDIVVRFFNYSDQPMTARQLLLTAVRVTTFCIRQRHCLTIFLSVCYRSLRPRKINAKLRSADPGCPGPADGVTVRSGARCGR